MRWPGASAGETTAGKGVVAVASGWTAVWNRDNVEERPAPPVLFDVIVVRRLSYGATGLASFLNLVSVPNQCAPPDTHPFPSKVATAFSPDVLRIGGQLRERRWEERVGCWGGLSSDDSVTLAAA